ncbi:MAG: ZIP family metal transporter [Oscillospiraceae bacterium]|nr:ZIP family metal transporter [Oscillospiraceae bacterium]
MQFFMGIHILWLSVLVGVVGMGTGGILSAMLGKKSEKTTSALLALAGGVMVAIVLLELIPESHEYGGALTAVLGLVTGAAAVWLSSFLLDKFTAKRKGVAQPLHENFEEYYHIKRRKSMLRTGLVMMFALAIHNIPEGMAMGAAGSPPDSSLGFILAVMLLLHNIPEGMAMASPLISGGFGRFKTVLLTLLTGFTTLFGTLIGMGLGGISDFALAFSLAFAGGAMLYVVFGEMLPHAITATKSRMPTIVMMAGIVLGFLITLIPH